MHACMHCTCSDMGHFRHTFRVNLSDDHGGVLVILRLFNPLLILEGHLLDNLLQPFPWLEWDAMGYKHRPFPRTYAIVIHAIASRHFCRIDPCMHKPHPYPLPSHKSKQCAEFQSSWWASGAGAHMPPLDLVEAVQVLHQKQCMTSSMHACTCTEG